MNERQVLIDSEKLDFDEQKEIFKKNMLEEQDKMAIKYKAEAEKLKKEKNELEKSREEFQKKKVNFSV